MLSAEDKVKIFKALGNDTRFKIFQNLFSAQYACSLDHKNLDDEMLESAICITDVSKDFDLAQPTISRHLQEMKSANVITMTKIKNKTYIEPNLKVMKLIDGCFTDLIINYENGLNAHFNNNE
jgi:ArsR family transcriptional regulator